MQKGLYVIVSGPSGVGKDTVVKQLEDIYLSVSATTRSPRGEERDGVDYLFYDKPEFEKTIADDGFLEYASYNDCYYGTPRDPAEKHYDNGETVVFVIDVQGARQIKEKYPGAVTVFIAAPSIECIRERLVNRHTENAEQIRRRLEICRSEYRKSADYDYIVINDRLGDAADDIKAIIRAEKRRASRNKSISMMEGF